MTDHRTMTTPRMFVRQRCSVQAWSFHLAQALRDALAVDGVAELWDQHSGEEPRLVFTLRVCGIATVILTPDGQHLATYADPVAGVAHGFGLIDRAAEHQRVARPRPTRARRPPTEKEIT